MSLKKICICLILIFCIIGAASAAEDVSTDVVDASDDAVAVDAVSEDVSDSLESVVVEDEPVVVDSAPAQEESVDEVSGQSILGINFEGQETIYVNSSSENSFIEVDGLSWETAVGTPDALALAVNFINNDGTIYIADGNYNRALFSGVKNITLIGQGKNTIINVSSTVYGSENDKSCKYTFINLTFNDLDSCRDADFINCTFINPISVAKDFTNYDEAHIDEYGYAKTYFMNFDNCEFNDFNDVSSLITLYKYGQAKDRKSVV